MAKQTINLGTAPDGKNGDTSRVAFVKAQANFDELYARTSDRLSKDISGAAGLVNLTDAEAVYGVIELKGAITGNREVSIPAAPSRLWVVWNNTTGAFTVKFRTQGGVGPLIEQGTAALLYSNGVDVLDVDGVLRSRIGAKADKTYVDTGIAAKADKTYVDTGLAGKVSATPGQGGGVYLRGDGAWSRALGSIYQSQSSSQPGYECHIPGVVAAMLYLQTDGNMVFANSNGASSWTSTRAILSTAGNLALAGTLSQASDARIKANIHTIQGALEKVRAIRGVTYQRMLPSTAPFQEGEPGAELPPKLGDIEVGVIAQEVQAVCPELVTVPDPEAGTLAVAYGSMVGLLLQAIKEMASAHDDLCARVAALEAQ
jgi:hypothetical protein